MNMIFKNLSGPQTQDIMDIIAEAEGNQFQL